MPPPPDLVICNDEPQASRLGDLKRPVGVVGEHDVTDKSTMLDQTIMSNRGGRKCSLSKPYGLVVTSLEELQQKVLNPNYGHRKYPPYV